MLLRSFSLEDGEGGAEDAEGVQVQGAVGDVVAVLHCLIVGGVARFLESLGSKISL